MVTEDLLTNRSFSWFDVEKPQDEDFETLSIKFNLPYLLVQDTLRPEHLPKYEYTDEGHFLMMRSYDEESGFDATTVQDLTRKIALFITTDRLVTIHRVKLSFLDKTLEKVKKNEVSATLQGVVHQIILSIIRTYEKPVMNLQDMFDEFEEEILSKNIGRLQTSKIYRFRRQLFVIKRILKQTNDSLYRSKEFWVDYPSLLQDLKENIDQVYFQLDDISDNFEHLFQLHISLNDQRANEVMKILTVFSTILLPLNFIASFYGMNFEYLPGLHSTTALIWVILSMIFISVSAFWFFRKRGWFQGGE
jgi:magnesium transporter